MGGSEVRRRSATAAWLAAIASTTALGACFFELHDVVTDGPATSSAGGAGGEGGSGASGGEGASGATGGGGSTSSAGSGGMGPAWWDAAWSRRVRLDIDNRQGGALADFPLLVTLDATRIDYALTQDDGADLRFVASDGATLLEHEIDRWDESGTSHVWVRVPDVSAASLDAHVWLYFGNDAAADAQDPAGVWAARYAAVYHLGDDPTGPTMADSTGHGHDGVPVQLDAGDRVDGRVGQALHFDGIATGAPRVALYDDQGALDVGPGEAMSFEIWAAHEPTTETAYVMMNEGCCEGVSLFFDGDAQLVATFSPDTGCCQPTAYSFAFAPTGVDDAWHYYVIVWNRADGSLVVYVDGVAVTSASIPTSMPSISEAPMHIGTDWDGASGMKGTLDEARFASEALSDAYIVAQFRSMTDRMIAYGPVETAPR